MTISVEASSPDIVNRRFIIFIYINIYIYYLLMFVVVDAVVDLTIACTIDVIQ